MWQVILRTADLQPHRINLEVGETSIGRAATNKIVVDDPAASRQHAKFIVSEDAKNISVVDLNSTNGTFLNSERIMMPVQLKNRDRLRIGQIVLTVQSLAMARSVSMARSHSYTRELVLESMDQHAILLYEVARKLNPVSDMDTAIHEIIQILSNAMSVDACQVILKSGFDSLARQGLDHDLSNKAIKKLSAEVTLSEMYIPVVIGDEVLALLYMKRLVPGTRPFDRSDLQLGIAISHQVSLTLHRLQIMDQMREEESIKQMLMRFFTPMNAEKFIKTYKETGKLPGLEEQKVTVMFSDIADSTGMAEKLGTSKFAAVLSSYYEMVTNIIFKHNGIVKYLGDGILAIFPEENIKDHEKEAILAARELVTRVQQTGFLVDGRQTVIGISINTGSAMLGYVGTKESAEFNVLGDVVNVAYHLQGRARPNKIIVSSSTIAAINKEFLFQRVGSITMKGRLKGVQAFEVLP